MQKLLSFACPFLLLTRNNLQIVRHIILNAFLKFKLQLKQDLNSIFMKGFKSCSALVSKAPLSFLLLTRTMLLWKFLAKCKNVIWHYQFTAFLYDILFQNTFPNYTYVYEFTRLSKVLPCWLLKTKKKVTTIYFVEIWKVFD